MLKTFVPSAICALALAGPAMAVNPSTPANTPPRPAAEVPMVSNGPIPTHETLPGSLLPALPYSLPSDPTAYLDESVDAVLLLPAIQAVQEPAQR